MRIFISILTAVIINGCGSEPPTTPPAGAGDGNAPVEAVDLSGQNLVWVAGGAFRMGSEKGEQDEKPVHQVKLNGFWIGKFEVTNAEFGEFAKATGYKTIAERVPRQEDFPNAPPENLRPGSLLFIPPKQEVPPGELHRPGAVRQWWVYKHGANWREPNGPGGEKVENWLKHPVVHVSWYDAVAYCEWKTKATGMSHRLPTEAEWEYAARGGLREMEYIWGTEQEPLGKPMANIWHGKFPVENTKKDGFFATAPVGSFPVNGYGLHDMAGNVWEWCSDWYSPEYYAKSVVSNPKGPPVEKSYDPNEPGSKKRIQRGGSFLCTDQYCGAFRPSTRKRTTPDTGASHAGFRVVVEAPAPPKK